MSELYDQEVDQTLPPSGGEPNPSENNSWYIKSAAGLGVLALASGIGLYEINKDDGNSPNDLTKHEKNANAYIKSPK